MGVASDMMNANLLRPTLLYLNQDLPTKHQLALNRRSSALCVFLATEYYLYAATPP